MIHPWETDGDEWKYSDGVRGYRFEEFGWPPYSPYVPLQWINMDKFSLTISKLEDAIQGKVPGHTYEFVRKVPYDRLCVMYTLYRDGVHTNFEVNIEQIQDRVTEQGMDYNFLFNEAVNDAIRYFLHHQ